MLFHASEGLFLIIDCLSKKLTASPNDVCIKRMFQDIFFLEICISIRPECLVLNWKCTILSLKKKLWGTILNKNLWSCPKATVITTFEQVFLRKKTRSRKSTRLKSIESSSIDINTKEIDWKMPLNKFRNSWTYCHLRTNSKDSKVKARKWFFAVGNVQYFGNERKWQATKQQYLFFFGREKILIQK